MHRVCRRPMITTREKEEQPVIPLTVDRVVHSLIPNSDVSRSFNPGSYISRFDRQVAPSCAARVKRRGLTILCLRVFSARWRRIA